MAFAFSDLGPAQLSPPRPEAPFVDFELEDLLHYDGLVMEDWLVGSQDPLPVDGSKRHLLPQSSDGPPSGSVPAVDNRDDSFKIENAGRGHSNNSRNATRTSDALTVQDVNSFGSQAPATLLPSKPSSKPSSTKKRKARPKDKLEALQKQLDDVMAQVQQLTLVNERLHCKNDVLTSLLECSDEVEHMSAAASRQFKACVQDPAGPHAPVIRTMHNLTPQSWLAFYHSKLAEMSHWLLRCCDADQAASGGAAKKLATLWKELCVHIQYAITLRRDVFFHVQHTTYQQFAHQHREVRLPARRSVLLSFRIFHPPAAAACCQLWCCSLALFVAVFLEMLRLPVLSDCSRAGGIRE
jgi:hypothetical protein